MLRQIPYGDGYGKRLQTEFKGLNHTLGAADGELFDCRNLSSASYPVMRPRKKRGLFAVLGKANGLGGRDALMWADGTEFFYDGAKKGDVADSRKQFYFLGPYVVIWPDKLFYNVKTDEFGSLEAEYVSGAGEISFSDGTYAEEPAEKNSIVTTGAPFPFEAGDAVVISGCAVEANNTTPIIREISEDRKTLRFYENCFAIESGTRYTEAGAVTLKRSVPDMDFLCENENRLWGCRGDEIYCSSLGNPKVWMDYDGLATGSWAGSVGSAGDFTGCASFLGYATFFKERAIHKVYGTKPSDFQYSDGPDMGLLSGCEGSLAVAGETLFYRSPAGIVRYNGGFPYLIDRELGELSPRGCAAGSDGRRYYISGTDSGGQDVFLCYDTQTRLWMREDDIRAEAFALASDGLYFLAGNEIWKVEAGENTQAEETVTSWAEFADFYESSPNEKGLRAIQVLAEVPEGAALTASISVNGEPWRDIGSITGERKTMHKLEIIHERVFFWRLRLEGTGDWRVYSAAREYYPGSDQF